MSIIKKIQEYYANKRDIPTLFTTPSHNQGAFVIPILKKLLGKCYFKADFSEIEGFDNLRNPQNSLKDTQMKIEEIYNSKFSFMLTNGSSSGILAAMKAILSKDDKVIIARNCHVSVYNGLVITGAKPIWIYPEYDKEWGICTHINPQSVLSAIEANSDAKALIITSPTYDGIFSDIKTISQICKEKNITLIVDEAHGALLNFANLGQKPSILLGADISIQSLHKNAGAPNPCALLHVSKQSKLARETIQNSLNLFNTTSPPYPLLIAIEGTIEYLNSSTGRHYIQKLLKSIHKFKKSLPECVEVYDKNNDKSKLLLRFKRKDNEKIAGILNTKYFIEEEFSDKNHMLFITGIGTTERKLSILSNTLNKLSNIELDDITLGEQKLLQEAETIYSPAIAYDKNSTIISKKDAIGKICNEIIINYPPGIPILIPGEKISEHNVHHIQKDKIKVII